MRKSEANKIGHTAFVKIFILKDFHVVKIIFIFLITIIILYSVQGKLYAEPDTSIRVDQSINLNINEFFSYKIYFFPQIDKNVTNFNYIELGTGLQYQTPLPSLSFLVYYQQSYSKNNSNTWAIEHKPSFNINISSINQWLKIYNQIRFEYRLTPGWNDLRIKNYLEFSLHKIFLKPHIGWELFYENHYHDIVHQRLKFGIIENIYKSISAGVYYRLDFSKIDGSWIFSRQLFGFQFTLNY